MGAPTSRISNSVEPIESTRLNNTQNSSWKKVPNTKQKPLDNLNNKFVVIWLDPNFNQSDVIYQNCITRLQRISVSINPFANLNDCLKFLNKIKDTKILMVIANDLINEIWPRIKSITQIYSIYILSTNGQEKEYPKPEYDKIKGTFNKIDFLYGSLKRETRQYHQEILVMSIIPSTNYSKNDLKQLNHLFLYWFLVKQIILDTKYDQDAQIQLAEFCRSHYTDNSAELKIIDEFEKSYHDHTPICWYTRKCFLYVMLNRALQTEDIEVIIQMGSFIQDLHRQLERLQANNEDVMVLYRSQNASMEDFEKMKTSQGHLLSFNNFLLADTDYQTSLEDARRARLNPNAIGVLFRIETAFHSPTAPFGSLKNLSYYSEQESSILFSMHSVFRIGEIKQIEDRLWQINLTLIDCYDQQMIRLQELIQQETHDVI